MGIRSINKPALPLLFHLLLSLFPFLSSIQLAAVGNHYPQPCMHLGNVQWCIPMYNTSAVIKWCTVPMTVYANRNLVKS